MLAHALILAPLMVPQASAAPRCYREAGHWAHGPSEAVTVYGQWLLAGSGATLVVADRSQALAPTVVAEVTLPSVVVNISAEGGLAAVAMEEAGFALVDLGDPANPSILSRVVLPDRSAESVAITGQLAVVGWGGYRERGLLLFDISDPMAPAPLGSWEDSLFNGPTNVIAVGDVAFFAWPGVGLLFSVDISDPTSPLPLGSLSLDGAISGMDLGDDGRLHLSFNILHPGNAGIVVVDISSPSSPEIVESFTLPGAYFRDVATEGAFDHLAGDGVRVIEMAPGPPAELGAVEVPGTPRRLAVGEGVVYAACRSYGVQVVDAIDPHGPSVVGSYEPPFVRYGYWAVASTGELVVAVRGNAVDVFDLSLPGPLEPIGTVGAAQLSLALAAEGTKAYLVNSVTGRLSVIDLGDPALPEQVGSLDAIDGQAYGVAVSGTHVFVAVEDQGLVAIDVSDPTAPVAVGALGGLDATWDVAVEGGLAILAVAGGVVVVDVSDPSAPIERGRWTGSPWPNAVAAEGATVLVGDNWNGTYVLDISNPATPTLIGEVDAERAVDVVISGDRGFVGDRAQGLLVVDLSNPAAPVVTGSRPQNAIHGVAASGSLALVAHDDGLTVVDGSAPAGPRHVGSVDGLDPTGELTVVEVEGDLALAADFTNGLRVIDLAQPGGPPEVAVVEVPGRPLDVATRDGLAVVSGWDWLAVVELDPDQGPRLAGTWDLFGYDPPGMVRIALAGNVAVAALGGCSGIRLIDLADPEDPQSVGTYASDLCYWRAADVDAEGSVVWIAAPGRGNPGDSVRAVDVSDPSAPLELGILSLDRREPEAVVVDDGRVCVLAGGYLHVIDGSDPSNPVSLVTIDVPRYPVEDDYGSHLAVESGLVAIPGGAYPSTVVDIADPTAPVMTFFEMYGFARDVAWHGSSVVVANEADGLRVFDPCPGVRRPTGRRRSSP